MKRFARFPFGIISLIWIGYLVWILLNLNHVPKKVGLDPDPIVKEGHSVEAGGLKISFDKVETVMEAVGEEKAIATSFFITNNGDSEAYISPSDYTLYADDQLCDQSPLYKGDVGTLSPRRKNFVQSLVGSSGKCKINRNRIQVLLSDRLQYFQIKVSILTVLWGLRPLSEPFL